MPTYDEWLGELNFTIFARHMSQHCGIPFTLQWNMLPHAERQAYIEAAKTLHEVGTNAKRRETRPDSSTSPLAHSGSSFG